MIFERIEIRNLFSYRHAVFDLDGPGPGRNIALISGRNGYGKTSFINAVKLLFVGPSQDLRAAVQRGRDLKPRQYVLGLGEEWLGIMNRRARRAGETRCEVRIRWREPSGPVEAVRRWDLGRDRYDETLEVDRRGEAPRHLAGDDAQQFLVERLPEDYLPFFFYDGEQIQQLAEAVRPRQVEQLERLLNISKIESLLEYLDKVMRGWNKGAMEAGERSQLKKLEGERDALEAEDAALLETAAALADERDELRRRIREEDGYLEGRRAAVLARDEAHLKEERSRLEDALEVAQARLAAALVPAAPLLVNPSLVRDVVTGLEKIVRSEAGHQAQALQEVLRDLPQDLFDKPPFPSPPLSEGQARFYKRRLEGLLSTYIPSPADFLEGPLRLETGFARELLGQFQHYAQAHQERSDRAGDLRAITLDKRRLREVAERLEDMSVLSPDEQRDYRERKAANDSRKARVGAIDQELLQNERKRQELERRRGDKEQEIRAQERRVILSGQARRRMERAQEARDFFVAYKDALRQDRRDALEQAVNARFGQLMTSHRMIRHIRVDEHFGLHFLDAEGEPVAMGSLSAGMKQLVATALLWALKEVSGKAVPLVIDTPLARIDRAHQENLLSRYYPHAGEQVILLPTDSELDREKYALLAPHVSGLRRGQP